MNYSEGKQKSPLFDILVVSLAVVEPPPALAHSLHSFDRPEDLNHGSSEDLNF